MAVTRIQEWAGVFSGTGTVSLVKGAGAALTANSRVVVALRRATGTTISSVPTGFVSVFSSDNGAIILEVYQGKSTGGEESLDFVESGTAMGGSMIECGNISLAPNPVDVSAVVQSASAETAATGTTGLTGQADEIAIAVAAWQGGFVTSESCATSFTLGSGATPSQPRVSMAWKILSVIGTQSGQWSWTTARASICGIITLKGFPGGYTNLPLRGVGG